MLTIADLHAEYFVPAGAPDTAALQRRLDRVARDRLPHELDRGLATFDNGDGAVIRIRQLGLGLWIDALAMSDADIARAWGGLVTRAVARALMAGSPAEVVRYDDPAHFVAAFLSDLLAGTAWSRWTYAEFSPLRDLPPGAVAAQVLAARPALLIPVARRLAQARQLEALIARMQTADVRLIVHSGLGFDAAPAAVPDDAGPLLDLLRGQVALERGAGAGAQARNTLRAYLAAMLRGVQPVPPAAALAVAYHLALVHALWSARPAPALWSALAAGEIGDPAALQPLLASPDPELEAARTWLIAMLVAAHGRDYLARLLPAAVPAIRAPDAIPGRRKAGAAEGRELRTASAFAGLALLLPAVRDLALYEPLNRAGIYQLLLAAPGRRLQPLAAGDLGVAWLAGLPPEETARARAAAIAWPDPVGWHDPAVTTGVEAAADHLGRGPAAAFAWLALRRFARGLPGFADSSPAYLAAQFLNVAGELRLSEDSLEVTVSQAPLRVVLHMAGRSGEQGAIPWLDGRQLIVHLPE